jgi:hypothetical protein
MVDVAQPPDMIALEQAVRDVFVLGTKSITDYPPDYQQRMITFYRFSATRFESSQTVHVSITPDTLDII